MNFLTKSIAAIAGLGALALAAFAESVVVVPLEGNAYDTQHADDTSRSKNSASVFFSFEEPQGELQLSLVARGKAEYEISCRRQKYRVKTDSADFVPVPVGKITFPKAGYQRLDIRRISGDADGSIRDVSQLLFDGVVGKMNFVRDFSSYWGRRGPSVHMRYAMPFGKDIEYFYNEVRVPRGFDPVHSYFMACGFGEGYFGFQVNSPSERRVLFSVWSPYDTQDPKDIPEEYRVKLSKKGEGVTVQDFGNEGSGGQSFLRYPWKAEQTYGFLVRIRPLANDYTEYSGYFYAPEDGKWRLISQLIRPKTQTWVTGAHSFLENFSPESGWKTRFVGFTNQWMRDTEGKWYELTKAGFTIDETGRSGVRLDYSGGVSPSKKWFILGNGGFFTGATPYGTIFERQPTGMQPEIDLAALEAL